MRSWVCLALLAFHYGSPLLAQEISPESSILFNPAIAPIENVGACGPDGCFDSTTASEGGSFVSTRKYPNFIGWMSNPLYNIDPRSLTQIVPIFGSSWIRDNRALPDLDLQIYGPAISIALTDRFSVGLNQGGFAVAHIDRNDPTGLRVEGLGLTRGEAYGGSREGFLNLGGFAQYTLIEDVPNQFLATVGVRLIVPSGSYEIFQGKGPAQLAPYFTIGKEIEKFHVLMTGGYQFPLQSGNRELEIFYLNGHIDRQCFGWLYPLVEVNWTTHRTTINDLTLPVQQGFINFGNYEAIGDVVTVAAGLNLVLIQDRLELGGAYIRGVSTSNNNEIDAMMVKMVFRY